jgi:protein TonB
MLPSVPQHKESENQQIAITVEKGQDDVITEENSPGENMDVDKVEETAEEPEEVLGGIMAEENIQPGAGILVDDEFVTIIVVEDDSTIEPAMYGVAEDEEIMADINLSLEEPSISILDDEVIMLEEVAGAVSEQKMSSSKSQAKRRNNEEPQEKIFTMVEDMPEFPGGMDSLYKYIQTNIEIPVDSEAHMAGKTYVSFIVNKDGSISDVRLLRGFWDKFDQEVIRVVKAMPAWKPGEQRGQPIRVQMTLPISYIPPK